MDALDKFRVGQRVCSTRLAIRAGVFASTRRGRVVKIPTSWPYLMVKVVIDGQKTPSTYHKDFWKVTR